MRKIIFIIPLLVLIILVIGGALVYKDIHSKNTEGLGAMGWRDCIHSNSYNVKLIMPTAFGLPAQFALLPDGDIAIADTANNRILLFHNDAFETIVSGDVNAWAVAALPDNRIVYVKGSGELIALDYKTKKEEHLAQIEYQPQALAADKHGNIYIGTSHNNLYRFKDGKLEIFAKSLPFPDPGFPAITDIVVGLDGTVYVAGFERVVAVDPAGAVRTIADGLNYEPVWVEVGPDGMVYINDLSHGLQRFDPNTKQTSQLKIPYGFGDMLALTADKFFFYSHHGSFYTLNLQTGAITPVYVNAGNSFAFAAGADEKVFFATPPIEGVLKQHVVQLNSAGERIDLPNLEYEAIFTADVDKESNLHLLTDKGIVRINSDGSIKTVPINTKRELPYWKNLAVGNDHWYVIASDYNEKIEVISIDESGNVTFLPISFNRDSFGTSVYKVDDARIDVAPDGSLALIVTAKGSASQGPYLQRVYRANADGSNLKEITRLDSSRIAGMVDISVGPKNDIFVLTPRGKTGDPDSIYHIDQNGKVSEAVQICAGRDPKSIDVDPSGNIWFGSTLGVFRAEQ